MELYATWERLQDLMHGHGGRNIKDYYAQPTQSREHAYLASVFIELREGEFCGEWLFAGIENALQLVAAPVFKSLICELGDKNFLITITDAPESK